MKIAIMTNKMPPAGGGEKVAWDLACELAKEHDVYFLCFSNEDKEFTKNNVKVTYFKNAKISLLYWSTFGRIKFRNYLKKIKPDIINCHMIGIFSFLLIKEKIKSLVTIHNSTFENFKCSARKSYQFGYSMKKSYALSTVSNHVKNVFSKQFNRNDIILIPNGIDLDVFHPKTIEKEEKSIFYSGRIRESKNVKVLFELAKIMPDWKFTFAGKGDLVNSINLPNVSFLGNKMPNELSYLYSKAAYCIFPSLRENFPLVGLEAMACGSAVIATCQGFKEYIEHNKNGYICEEMTAEALKSFILSNNGKNLENVYKQALEDVQYYSVKNTAKMYLDAFRKILND